MTYRIYVCGEPTVCPHDPHFVHESWPFGCVPKDFKYTAGTSRTRHQTAFIFPGLGLRYQWNGGCDAAGVLPHDLAERRWPGPPAPAPKRRSRRAPL